MVKNMTNRLMTWESNDVTQSPDVSLVYTIAGPGEEGSVAVSLDDLIPGAALRVGRDAPEGPFRDYLQQRESLPLNYRPFLRDGKIVELMINYVSVSRTHFFLLYNGEDYYIIDVGSKNGTYVNGELIGSLQDNRLVPVVEYSMMEELSENMQRDRHMGIKQLYDGDLIGFGSGRLRFSDKRSETRSFRTPTLESSWDLYGKYCIQEADKPMLYREYLGYVMVGQQSIMGQYVGPDNFQKGIVERGEASLSGGVMDPDTAKFAFYAFVEKSRTVKSMDPFEVLGIYDLPAFNDPQCRDLSLLTESEVSSSYRQIMIRKGFHPDRLDQYTELFPAWHDLIADLSAKVNISYKLVLDYVRRQRG
jgi:pSer/pThr/pTyr-binding forkhead associated (FHA) protein